MTIDEAIKHYEAMAEVSKCAGEMLSNDAFLRTDLGDRKECREEAIASLEMSREYMQLAKWLKELQEAKRLLEMAVKDMNRHNICYGIRPCNVCTENQKRPCDTFKWRYTDEAMQLFGEEDEK